MNDQNYNPDDFRGVYLAGVGDFSYDLGIEYDTSLYQVNFKPLSKENKNIAKQKKSKFKLSKLFSFFEVMDMDKKPVHVFSPGLKFHFRFSPEAWEESVENNDGEKLDRPRAGYLVWKPGDADDDGTFPNDWIEFTENETTIIRSYPPGPENNTDGYLIIEVSQLEDPLIGSC